MKYLRHFLNVVFKILSTSYPYSRLGLLCDYVKLNLRSVTHHKITSKAGVLHIYLLGYHIHFLNYAHLINLLEDIFIWQAYKFQSSGEAPYIIDCGSNIGMSILYFKKVFPESQIIAFEPDPEAFSLLDITIQKNNLKNIRVFNYALSRSEGEVKLFRKSPAALTATVLSPDDSAESILIHTRKLSDLLTNPVDLIKLDIEGSEAQVIEDLIETRTINKAKTLIIEYHPRIVKVPVTQFINRIGSQGFTCTEQIQTSDSVAPDYVLHFQSNALPALAGAR